MMPCGRVFGSLSLKSRTRKVVVVFGGFVLAGLGFGAAWYVAHQPELQPHGGKEIFSIPEPVTVLSPSQLLQKPAITPPASSAESSSPATAASQGETRDETVVYPNWQPVGARVSGAQAISEKADFVAPVWSPVMLDVAFTKSDFRGIYIAGPNETASRMLASDPGIGRDFEWNIDGMSLRVKEPDGQFADLMITGERYPSTTRRQQVFERDGRVFFQPEDGAPVRISGSQDRFFGPRLSPDERKIVFQGRETGIYIAPVYGRPIISVGKGEHPAWLRDSSGIVYDVPVGDGTATVDGDLWFAAADGTERTNITNTPGIVETHPSLAADGERIVFSSSGAIFLGRFRREPPKPAQQQ